MKKEAEDGSKGNDLLEGEIVGGNNDGAAETLESKSRRTKENAK